MQRTIMMTLAVLALTASPALAHELEVPVGDDTYYVTPHPDHAADDPAHYAEEAQVWKETNGLPGLQKEAVSVDGRDYTADTRFA